MPQIGRYDGKTLVDGYRRDAAVARPHPLDHRRPTLIKVFVGLSVRQDPELPQKILGQHKVTVRDRDERAIPGPGRIQSRKDPQSAPELFFHDHGGQPELGRRDRKRPLVQGAVSAPEEKTCGIIVQNIHGLFGQPMLPV